MSTGIMFRTAIETKRKNSTKLKFLDPNSPINNPFWGILSLLEPFAWHSHVLGAGISQLFQRLDDSGVAIVGSSPISIQNGHWETGCPSGVPPTDDRKSFQIPYVWNKIHYLVMYVGHANKDWPTSGIKHCGWRSPDTARYRRLVPGILSQVSLCCLHWIKRFEGKHPRSHHFISFLSKTIKDSWIVKSNFSGWLPLAILAELPPLRSLRSWAELRLERGAQAAQEPRLSPLTPWACGSNPQKMSVSSAMAYEAQFRTNNCFPPPWLIFSPVFPARCLSKIVMCT